LASRALSTSSTDPKCTEPSYDWRQVGARHILAGRDSIDGRKEAVSVYPARFEYFATTTPSPHHPIGATGVGESATVGSPDMPMTPDKVSEALNEVGLAE
jgi:hypothetical protein